MKRILVCGGRDYADKQKVYKVLDQARDTFKDVTIIQGAAKGADSLADSWAADRGVRSDSFPADWKRYGKRSGYLRNVQMLNEGKPDIVVAFPGGAGTQMMINLAKSANVAVVMIK